MGRIREFTGYLLALMICILLSPFFVLVFLRIRDNNGTIRRLQNHAISCIHWIFNDIAQIQIVFQLLDQSIRYQIGGTCSNWIRFPTAVQWNSSFHVNARDSGTKTSTLIKCITFDQPGLWMSDEHLNKLHNWLIEIASNSIYCIPNHRVFSGKENVREVFRNRIVSIAFDCHGNPIGFSCMVYLPVFETRTELVLHLGMTMICREHRGRRIQSPLFTKCLVLPMLNLYRIQYWITSIAASSSGIGAICDYFLDAYPTYYSCGSSSRTKMHLDIASFVLQHYRHEFGCSTNARFDQDTFVVHESNQFEGGGCAELIQEDGLSVSQYRRGECNEFVKQMLDLRAGDELFQVAKVDLIQTSLRFLLTKETE